MNQPDLSIIVVSWNTQDLLRDCLRSVFAEPTGLTLDVIVWDNRSEDNSREIVRSEFPQARLIENPANIGFAAANNAAFPTCRADRILLLNSDAVVRGDALRVLITFLDAHPNAAAIAPRLLQTDAGLDILGCGELVTLRTAVNHWLFLARIFPNSDHFRGMYGYAGVDDVRSGEVGWVSGACMLVRRQVIEQIGGMNERWFMYAEDHEWCARMRRAGWHIYHVPEAVVEHRHGASTSKNPAISFMPLRADRELFVALNHPSGLELLAFDGVRTVGHLLRSAGYLARGIRHRDQAWIARAWLAFRYAWASLPRLSAE